MTQHVVHTALVVHPCGVALAALAAASCLHEELLRRLLVIEDGKRRLRGAGTGAGLNDEVLKRGDSGQTVASKAAEGEVVEGVAGKNAAGNAGGSEALDRGDLNAVELEKLDGLFLGDGAVLEVLLIEGLQDLAQTTDGLAGLRVLVDHSEVAQEGELEGLTEGRGLLVSDVVHNNSDVLVLLLLLRIGLALSEGLGTVAVVVGPSGETLGDLLHSHVVVATAHAQQTVAVLGKTEDLGDLLVAHLDNAVKTILERHVVVDDLAALRNGPRVKHDENGVAIGLVLVVVRNGLGVLLGNDLDGAVIPVPGNLHQNGDFFLAQTELLSDGNDVAIALGDVAATGTDDGHTVGLGQSRSLSLGEEGLSLGIEERSVDPREREGTTPVLGLIHNEQLARPDGRGGVCESSTISLSATNLGNVALVLPPDTVIPIWDLHIDGVLHLVVDVDELLKTRARRGNLFLGVAGVNRDVQALILPVACLENLKDLCLFVHGVPPCVQTCRP